MSDCQQLDDYLQGELPIDDEARFAEHLMVCEPCRVAVDQQQWLDGLLRSAVTAEPLPAELDELVTRPPTLSFPSRAWQIPVAAAAALLLALFLWPRSTTTDVVKPSVNKEVTTDSPSTASAPLAASHKPKATFIAEDDVIVVPIDSGSPEVSIIQVYPTAQARSRWRREALLQTTFVSNNGG